MSHLALVCLAAVVEQYYSTNVQKNQLVQNDIRLAKRMQDEEEEQQAQQSALLRQASRQMYAALNIDINTTNSCHLFITELTLNIFLFLH